MTTISDKDRAEAQAMAETLAGGALMTLGDNSVSRWLAVRACVFASHTCEPVWRPTTRDEIQAGWMIRSRRDNGSEASWGVAHHQNHNDNWFTESYTPLTWDTAGWTYETTAPLPAVDHTHTIAEAAREYVRALRAWESGVQPYPAAADDALVAAVEAEHTEKEES